AEHPGEAPGSVAAGGRLALRGDRRESERLVCVTRRPDPVSPPPPEDRVLPAILQGSSDLFLLVHRDDGTVLDVSDSFLELTGFSREEVVGRSTVELGMWRDREQRDRFVEDLIVSRRMSSVMRELPTKSGDIVLVEVSSHL